MYALLARIPEGLEPLRKKFEEHVKNAGLAAVAKLADTEGAEVDPKAYVDALLEVHTKNAETVNRSFKGEAGFVAALDKACRDFVNKNKATGNQPTRSPELLAKHADALLRKSNKMAEDEDLESALNRVVCLRSCHIPKTAILITISRWYSSSTWMTRTSSNNTTPRSSLSVLFTESLRQMRRRRA